MKKDIDLTEISNQVLEVLKRFDLKPYSFGLSIALEKDDFEYLAEKHPDHILPNIILKTKSESDGIQWSVQILGKMTLQDAPDENSA